MRAETMNHCVPPRHLHSRLCSIAYDAQWVRDILELFPTYAHVANERCGNWYCHKACSYSVYFKSTDGHNGDFSLRRLNLNLLHLLLQFPGVVLIDSTGRGKRIPDSLSKTVPIWCAVMNRAIRQHALATDLSHPAAQSGWDVELHVPSIVTKSQYEYYCSRLDGFVASFLQLKIDMSTLLASIKKPIRPLWLTPASRLFFNEPPDHSDCSFMPVLCITASLQAPEVEGNTYNIKYLQCSNESKQITIAFSYMAGAGDDHETWSCGLTPLLFWQHYQRLILAEPMFCEQLVKQIVRDAQVNTVSLIASPLHILCWIPYEDGVRLGVAASDASSYTSQSIHFDPRSATSALIVDCNAQTSCSSADRLCLGITQGKTGRAAFAANLPHTVPSLVQTLQHRRSVLLVCKTGTEIASALALSVIVAGSLVDQQEQRSTIQPTKTMIASCLAKLTSAHPAINPPRALIKAVNSYFLTHPNYL